MPFGVAFEIVAVFLTIVVTIPALVAGRVMIRASTVIAVLVLVFGHILIALIMGFLVDCFDYHGGPLS